MYKDVGNSIKKWAKACAIVGIALAVFVGLFLCVYGLSIGEITYVILGVVETLLLMFAAWLAQLCLYGYGQLIDANDRTNEKLDKIISLLNKK